VRARIGVVATAVAVGLSGCGAAATSGPQGSRPAADGARAAATVPARNALASLSGRVIVIDPGHNPGNATHAREINRLVFAGVPENHGYKACDTAGTATAGGYTEAAFTWDVSRRLVRILRAAGAHVILTRTAHHPAYGPCIDRRARIGNRAHADAAVSIHADGGPASGHGFALITPATPIAATGLTARMVAADVALAVALRRAYHAGTGLPTSTYLGRHGIYRSNEYGGTNLSHVPKVFIETGNMQNRGDAAKLESAAFRARIAQALAAGLAAYLR
jgi:N-acetylmuramoyl-L-alanine amidase